MLRGKLRKIELDREWNLSVKYPDGWKYIDTYDTFEEARVDASEYMDAGQDANIEEVIK